MVTTDISIFESGDGGEFSIVAGDLNFSETLYQQVYLALFGGNVEANTKANTLFTEERFDYWGNSLFWGNSSGEQFNSNTERVLESVILNSSGRLLIEQAVVDDLAYLSDLLTAEVSVQLLETDKIRITITFTPKGNQESKVLQLVYNNAKKELLIEKTI